MGKKGGEREKDPSAVKLGRKGGKKGGPARMAALTHEERQEMGRKGAEARWGMPPAPTSPAMEPPKEEKDPMAVSLGRRGGLQGGKARMATLSRSDRTVLGKRAAAARWKQPAPPWPPPAPPPGQEVPPLPPTPEWDRQPLGRKTDGEMAEALDTTREAVAQARKRRGIPALRVPSPADIEAGAGDLDGVEQMLRRHRDEDT